MRREKGERTESLLDGLHVVVISSARLASLEQSLQEDVFRAGEEENERRWADLFVILSSRCVVTPREVERGAKWNAGLTVSSNSYA